VAVAHGSKDPRAAATVTSLVDVVRRRAAGAGARAAFLDHCAPTLPQALESLAGGRCVVVPLLLTAAYHSKTDIPARLAACAAACPGLDVTLAGPLGPHPLLLAALERRLGEAGAPAGSAAGRASTSVVLAAAGSADPAANAAVAAVAARWQAARGWAAVVPGYASAAGPGAGMQGPGEAVAALRGGGAGRVVVASYLLAPGYFADKVRDAALGAGADTVAAPLGAAPEVAAVVLDRYRAALRGARAGAGARPVVARAQLPDAQGNRCPVRRPPLRGTPTRNGRTAQAAPTLNMTRYASWVRVVTG